jgi:molecular chaperone GrpE
MTEEQQQQPEETTEGAQPEEPRFERRWSKKQTSSAPQPEAPVAASDGSSEKARGDELYDRLQRALADLSNFRKRADAEREEMAKFASMLLVAELLPVLDNFERALKTIPNELVQLTWIQGVLLMERHFRAILERQGVEAIEAEGKPFNTGLHEAIVEEESTSVEPGSIITDLQTGYTMHGRVIRPSLVKVARAPSAAADGEVGAPASTESLMPPPDGED